MAKLSGATGGALGFLAFAIVAALIGALAYTALGAKPPLIFPILASLFLAVVTPLTIIAIRHQIRLTRIKLIDLFAKSLRLSPATPDRDSSPKDDKKNLSFEFVKGKYYVDLNLPEGAEPTQNDIPRFPMMLHADWMLLLCALPFIAFSGFGVFLIFAPIVEILQPGGGVGSWLGGSLLALGGAPQALLLSPTDMPAQHVNTLTVAAMAFAGSYFYCIRLLLRAVAVFDLSPLTFLRAFAQMVLATTLAVVLYRVFPSVEGAAGFVREVSAAVTGDQAASVDPVYPDPKQGVNAIWLILAFALGFVPETAIQYVLQRSGVKFKARYDEVEDHARTIPLTILDGVDSFTAFRLEESNVFDVQNLAASNAIMLHIESPYGIYETIDWVAQAQLCTIVGPEKFLLFKMHNIRTIFDLERAVLSDHSDDSVLRLVGTILFSDTRRDKACKAAFGLVPTYSARDPATPDDLLANVRGLSPAAVRHAVRLIIDDLHVHRLRQIWLLIADELGAKYQAFSDTARHAHGGDGPDLQEAA
jgi:hypothetical protein